MLVTAPFCCDRKSRAACAQSFALWQQATIEIMRRAHFVVACSRHLHLGVILSALPVCGASRIQRNAEKLQQSFVQSDGETGKVNHHSICQFRDVSRSLFPRT